MTSSAQNIREFLSASLDTGLHVHPAEEDAREALCLDAPVTRRKKRHTRS